MTLDPSCSWARATPLFSSLWNHLYEYLLNRCRVLKMSLVPKRKNISLVLHKTSVLLTVEIPLLNVLCAPPLFYYI